MNSYCMRRIPAARREGMKAKLIMSGITTVPRAPYMPGRNNDYFSRTEREIRYGYNIRVTTRTR